MNVAGARRRVVVATVDTLTKQMAGPAIRAWHIAEALSKEHDVELVTTVTLTLGSPPGTSLELRLGAAPDLTALPVVATGTATRDQLSLPLASPAKGRYVLLWFTRLPPDDAGTYELFVHQVAIKGRP